MKSELNEALDSAVAQAMAEENLGNIDIDYIIGEIQDQLNNLTSSENSKNFFKYFEKQLDNLKLTEDEMNVKDIADNMYIRILDAIAERFDIEIDTETEELKPMAKTFYKFFVVNYQRVLTEFVISYIVENRDDIVANLRYSDRLVTKQVEDCSTDISLILNNTSKVIQLISEAKLDFYDFLEYVGKHPDSPASLEKMHRFYNDYVTETSTNIVDKLMEPITNEEEDFGDILIAIQTEIYENFTNSSEGDTDGTNDYDY